MHSNVQETIIKQTKEYRKKIKDYCGNNQLFIIFNFSLVLPSIY